MGGQLMYVNKQKAISLLPYLKWIEESAPYVRYRRAAKSLAGKLRTARDMEWIQIVLSRQELDVLKAVYGAFDFRKIEEPRQLKLL